LANHALSGKIDHSTNFIFGNELKDFTAIVIQIPLSPGVVFSLMIIWVE
jgi:hypothetical protein